MRAEEVSQDGANRWGFTAETAAEDIVTQIDMTVQIRKVQSGRRPARGRAIVESGTRRPAKIARVYRLPAKEKIYPYYHTKTMMRGRMWDVLSRFRRSDPKPV